MSFKSETENRKAKLRPYSQVDDRPVPSRAYAGQEGIKAASRIFIRPSRRKGLIGRRYGRK